MDRTSKPSSAHRMTVMATTMTCIGLIGASAINCRGSVLMFASSVVGDNGKHNATRRAVRVNRLLWGSRLGYSIPQ